MDIRCVFGHDWQLHKENQRGKSIYDITGYKVVHWIGDVYRCRRCLKERIIVNHREMEYNV